VVRPVEKSGVESTLVAEFCQIRSKRPLIEAASLNLAHR